MAPEPKDDEFDSFLEPCFFRANSFQIGLGTSNFFYCDGFTLPNKTLIQETYRCSQI